MKFTQKINYTIQRLKGKLFPFTFCSSRYSDTFLSEVSSRNHEMIVKIPKVIYCFWTGTNEMPPNRVRAVDKLLHMSKVPVQVITPETLPQYIKPEYPLHSTYPFLSLVHKSDYLRCYFMHHYGGGYSDIKTPRKSWLSTFAHFDKQVDQYLIGYPEIGSYAVAQLEGVLGEDLKKNFHIVLGNCAYISRAYSPFTFDWMTELHKRLDRYEQELQRFPGNVMGDNEGYPIPWTGILGDIFHPLCLKYHQNISYSTQIKPSFKNYR